MSKLASNLLIDLQFNSYFRRVTRRMPASGDRNGINVIADLMAPMIVGSELWFPTQRIWTEANGRVHEQHIP